MPGYVRSSSASSSAPKRMRSSVVSKSKPKYKTNNIPVKIRVGRQPIPKQFYNTMKYSEMVSFNLGITSLGSYLFSANGLYDPNISGTGHQPMYFDQLTALYDHYTVLKSKIKMTLLSTNGWTGSVVMSLGTDDDTTLVAAASHVIWERPTFKTKLMNPAVEPSQCVLTNSWDAKKVFGGDPQSKNELSGSSSANPTEQTYWVVYCDALPAGISLAVTIKVEIEYDVVWDELTSIATS